MPPASAAYHEGHEGHEGGAGVGVREAHTHAYQRGINPPPENSSPLKRAAPTPDTRHLCYTEMRCDLRFAIKSAQ